MSLSSLIAWKERPILFNGEMVRAILEGRKTQTRRVIKHKLMEFVGGRGCLDDPESWGYADEFGEFHCLPERGKAPSREDIQCPYGVPGDRLWVREKWGTGTRPCPFEGCYDGIEYKLDESFLLDDIEDLPLHKVDAPGDFCFDEIAGWQPANTMPRWASRILLEITNVRAERVQDISCADCFAEGIFKQANEFSIDCETPDPRHEFRELWNSINEAKGFGWDKNPWVWVVEFKVNKSKNST